jgi:hypothetical protein
LAFVLLLTFGCDRDPVLVVKATKPAAGLVPAPASSVKGKIKWAGYYEVEGPLCSDTETWGPCHREFKDCILVRNSENGWHVELYSVQAVQSICAFSLQMHQVGGKLVYSDGKGGEITIQEEGQRLVLSSLALDPGKAGFCGAHAGIDGISFPMSSKKSVDKRCFAENNDVMGP